MVEAREKKQFNKGKKGPKPDVRTEISLLESLFSQSISEGRRGEIENDNNRQMGVPESKISCALPNENSLNGLRSLEKKDY